MARQVEDKAAPMAKGAKEREGDRGPEPHTWRQEIPIKCSKSTKLTRCLYCDAVSETALPSAFTIITLIAKVGGVMRLFSYVFILAVGWLIGSLFPAPPVILDPIEDGLSRILDRAPMDREEQNQDDDPSTVATPSSDTTVVDSGDETLETYRAWMVEAREIHPYPESVDRMYAVMMCESGGNATIASPTGIYQGLFQYSTTTWNGNWNQYRNQGILNPRAQIFATALAWEIGMQSQWGCYNKTS